jgi:hypothetical protein
MLDLRNRHAIVEQMIKDGRTHLVVVVGLGFDVFDLRADGSATVAGSAVFGGGEMKEQDGRVGDGADGALVASLAAPESAAVRAGRFLGSVAAVGVKDLGSGWGSVAWAWGKCTTVMG